MHPGYYPPRPMWHGQPVPPGYPPMSPPHPRQGLPLPRGHYGAPPPRGPYVPLLAYGPQVLHGAPPGYRPAGPLLHAGHPATAGPPGAAVLGQPPPMRPALWPAPGSAHHQALDFAVEKPQAFQAFVNLAVHTGEGGTTVGLPNSMCLDRHVPDFLICLECWLCRTFGPADAVRNPWRLQCLDLSRNSLSDASMCHVLATLKRLDIRIERLWLSGNLMAEAGCAALTEYLWCCRDALVEVDVADNEIRADPTAGPEPGTDVVSSFLRCIYNHAAYPLVFDQGGVKVLPILLSMGNNFISHPDKLIRMIRSKGGKASVHICPGVEPYPRGDEKEYLSVCLPDFLAQRGVGGSVAQAPSAAAPAAPVAERGKRKRTHEHGKEKKKKDNHDGKERKRRKERGEGAADVAGGPDVLRFSAADQRQLQGDIELHLQTGGDLSGEESARTLLSELAVCMLVAKKPMPEIADELVPFVGSQSAAFTRWLEGHLEERYPDLMSQLHRAWGS